MQGEWYVIGAGPSGLTEYTDFLMPREWPAYPDQRQRPARGGSIRYVDSPRHRLEVEYFAYRKQLQRLIAGTGKRIALPTSQTALRDRGRGRR